MFWGLRCGCHEENERSNEGLKGYEMKIKGDRK
jgi:hypothetical protein